jgi:hypothetical protein
MSTGGLDSSGAPRGCALPGYHGKSHEIRSARSNEYKGSFVVQFGQVGVLALLHSRTGL